MKKQLFDAIQKFREYRDNTIEIKYDFNKLMEREMEILTMENEREKRFKNNLKKETRKIHESNLDDSILDGDIKKLINHINQNMNKLIIIYEKIIILVVMYIKISNAQNIYLKLNIQFTMK